MGRVASAVGSIVGLKLDQTIVRNAYYHFEALTEHDYNFACVLCGNYPPHLNWDLCKKGCFSVAHTYATINGHDLSFCVALSLRIT